MTSSTVGTCVIWESTGFHGVQDAIDASRIRISYYKVRLVDTTHRTTITGSSSNQRRLVRITNRGGIESTDPNLLYDGVRRTPEGRHMQIQFYGFLYRLVL